MVTAKDDDGKMLNKRYMMFIPCILIEFDCHICDIYPIYILRYVAIKLVSLSHVSLEVEEDGKRTIMCSKHVC